MSRTFTATSTSTHSTSRRYRMPFLPASPSTSSSRSALNSPQDTIMATATIVHTADTNLSRSYAPGVVPNSSCFTATKFDSAQSHQPIQTSPSSDSLHWPDDKGNRVPRLAAPRRPSFTQRPSMVQSSTKQMPSFMSVFGEEVSNTGLKESAHGGSLGRPASSGNITNTSNPHYSGFHVHRDSTSTLASESSDSSPTTTISTMDSSSATELSAGPSPESPSAKVIASAFSADFRSRKVDAGSSENSPTTFFELQRPVTPAKKPRNLKNLGINTASSLGNLRSNTTGSLPLLAPKEKNTSAPASPSFIKPPTPPKRRPSNLSLTIQTPGSDTKPTRLVIPSTPSLNRPALRHFQSSPSLPLCAPTVVPAGGMRLPALRPIKTNPHGFAEVPVEIEEEDQEPNFDVPQSREEKPAAYPNGPICIYECGVYLYFEPTAEQASTFDVIVNVASEVKNPFTTPASISQKELDARRIDGPPAENVDFASLPERTKAPSIDTENNSPTTPKATPVLEVSQPSEQVVNGTSFKTPEYIHMPWEHNTDIVPDLYKLVKKMDDRVQQGKRILVHCQCGVSRSASLIVAYGLYKNPGISVQEAYDAVKKRSKWIGPNMNLIMQLQEFRNGLLRANEGRHNQGFGHPRRSAGLPTGVSNGATRHSPFDRELPSGSRTPRTAPLPPESDMSMQRASTGNMMSVSPGPLSAPSGAFFSPGFRRSWASSQTHFDLSPKASPTQSATPYVDPKGHVVPVLSITDNDWSKSPAEKQADQGETPQERSVDAVPLPVPNFSRQLPLRNSMINGSNDDNRLSAAPPSQVFLAAPQAPAGMDAMLSPTVTSFSIPPLSPFGRPSDDDMLPMRRNEFGIPPWSRDDVDDTQSIPSSPPAYEQSLSPRSTEFHMTGLSHGHNEDSYGLTSPQSTSFGFTQSPSSAGDRSLEDYEITSPVATEFPKDPFARTTEVADFEIASPRATEFHMTPLKPKLANEDPFGLTSPKKFEFANSIFDNASSPPQHLDDSELRRPSFQAILPPSNLAQPEAENGLTSLNGIAQAQPIIALPEPPPKIESLKHSEESSRIDSLNAQELPSTTAIAEPQTPQPLPSLITKTERLFLSTPPRQPGLRTRFSSPNMREQRRLQKLQTEMEALLPQRAPHPPQAADDLDALMSPRAEEFTRNPFHFDLRTAPEDTSPASSTETIKEDRTWKDTQHLTPQKVAQDPRSPVQTGSSPIVRNIWDVL